MSDDRTLHLSRVFDASPEAVFALWADPDHVRDWWHPAGFETSVVEIDFREGGAWRLGFHRDGQDICAAGIYETIRAPLCIVMSFRWESGEHRSDPSTRVTLDFRPEGDARTRLDFRQEPFATASERDAHVVGWSQVLDSFSQALVAEVQS